MDWKVNQYDELVLKRGKIDWNHKFHEITCYMSGWGTDLEIAQQKEDAGDDFMEVYAINTCSFNALIESNYMLNRIIRHRTEEEERNLQIEHWANIIKDWDDTHNPIPWRKVAALMLQFPEHTHFDFPNYPECPACGKKKMIIYAQQEWPWEKGLLPDKNIIICLNCHAQQLCTDEDILE